MSSPTLMDLSAQLDSDDTLTVLSGAWDALTVATEVADAIAFDEGSDELQALLAAQQCMEGRDRLPLPTAGRPVSAERPGLWAASLTPYVHLLQHVDAALTRISETADGTAEAQQSLLLTAQLAANAARALSFVRER
ncbi:hypothetical protein [Streptomyces sp. NPDC047718]|uniref:hypothetical protein n=1 Tax=Streptomyces sp. NPDC047718 TaxID=3155479 RepID=UPI0033C27902